MHTIYYSIKTNLALFIYVLCTNILTYSKEVDLIMFIFTKLGKILMESYNHYLTKMVYSGVIKLLNSKHIIYFLPISTSWKAIILSPVYNLLRHISILCKAFMDSFFPFIKLFRQLPFFERSLHNQNFWLLVFLNKCVGLSSADSKDCLND